MDNLKRRECYVGNGKQISKEDGVIVDEIPLDGNGVARRFHPSGAVASETPRLNCEAHGIQRKWHDNGQLASEVQYVNGKHTGIARDWDRDGSLLHERVYILAHAVFGKTYADPVKVHHVFLWNGKPLSRARWLNKLEAAGVSREELMKRFRDAYTE